MEFVQEANLTYMGRDVSYYMNRTSGMLAYLGCGILTLTFKGMAMWHTIKYAPKGRPINWMTFCDQVTQNA